MATVQGAAGAAVRGVASCPVPSASRRAAEEGAKRQHEKRPCLHCRLDIAIMGSMHFQSVTVASTPRLWRAHRSVRVANATGASDHGQCAMACTADHGEAKIHTGTGRTDRRRKRRRVEPWQWNAGYPRRVLVRLPQRGPPYGQPVSQSMNEPHREACIPAIRSGSRPCDAAHPPCSQLRLSRAPRNLLLYLGARPSQRRRPHSLLLQCCRGRLRCASRRRETSGLPCC